MRPFAYSRGTSPGEALTATSRGCRPFAGGTDLLPLLKADIQQADSLIDIKYAGLPAGIEASGRTIRIGALATIAEIADHPLLRKKYPLLVEAARETATVQIRNRATLGGNLLQRPRCWYYRNFRAQCWLKGGSDCLAVEGRNEQHALFSSGICKSVHPSDLAGCLLALKAEVTLQHKDGERHLTLSDFFAEADASRRSETVIRKHELLTCIDIPLLDAGWSSCYLKAMDRKVWSFALAGIAVVIHKTGDGIDGVRLVANGVAPVPWRLHECEKALRGSAGTKTDIEKAVEQVAVNAQPLSENAYKLELLKRLLAKALTRLLS